MMLIQTITKIMLKLLITNSTDSIKDFNANNVTWNSSIPKNILCSFPVTQWSHILLAYYMIFDVHILIGLCMYLHIHACMHVPTCVAECIHSW